MRKGTKENPYTREDVLRMIDENDGKAAGIDFSGNYFETEINLKGSDLSGVILKDAKLPNACLEEANLSLSNLEGTELWGANLQGANLAWANVKHAYLVAANLNKAYLVDANLEKAILREAFLKEANLFEVNLEEADLHQANLEKAILVSTNLNRVNFEFANMEEVCLIWARFSTDISLEGVDWGNYILGEEKRGDFNLAEDVYRRLKIWYTTAGMYDVAGEFYYREMETKRKTAQGQIHEQLRKFKVRHFLHFIFRKKVFGNWLRLWIYGLLCGYGERPWQVFINAGVVILGFGLIYSAIGTLKPNDLLNSLYYSAVSFTALGYGGWAPEPTGWVKGLGAFEAFVGVFMMALFLVTFTRKMTR